MAGNFAHSTRLQSRRPKANNVRNDSMAGSTFIYVTYIRTSPDELWSALTSPEFTKKYWSGVYPDSDWKAGSSWKLVLPDGRTADTGEIVEIDAPRRLVLRWRNEFRPEMKAEGYSRCVVEIEPAGDAVKLTITHTMDRDKSKFIDAVSGGWPRILSNLKSLLETGKIVLT
jgi:uncharacterized protein YndB with AHSA1/START domain